MRPDTLMIVNFEAAKYGYYREQPMEKKNSTQDDTSDGSYHSRPMESSCAIPGPI